jgi:hypothetical protein
VETVSFSPDGGRIASGSIDKTVRVWDAASGRELACLRGHEDCVLSVSFSPDGRRIASGSNDKTVRVWDAASGRKLVCLRGHERQVTSVCFSPDGGRIASGSYDNTVRVWDTASGECLEVIEAWKADVTAIADPEHFPWRAISLGLDTHIEMARNQQVIAWFSDRSGHLVVYPSSCMCAGTVGSHLYLLTLEGGDPLEASRLHQNSLPRNEYSDPKKRNTKKRTTPQPIETIREHVVRKADLPFAQTLTSEARAVYAPEDPSVALRKAKSLVDAGKLQESLDAIKRSRFQGRALRNVKGVCLLRLGDSQSAVELFRQLTMTPGTVTLRTDCRMIYKTNFATALFMANNVSGCISVLDEINIENNPTVQRLRAAIKNWEKGLSFFQRMQWRLGIEPSKPVELNFPPGEF